MLNAQCFSFIIQYSSFLLFVAMNKILSTLIRGGELPRTRVYGQFYAMGSLDGVILYRKHGSLREAEIRLVVLALKRAGYRLASETRFDEAKNIWKGVFTDDRKTKASQSQKLSEKEGGGEVEAKPTTKGLPRGTKG